LSAQFEIRVITGNSEAAVKGVVNEIGKAATATTGLNSKLQAIGNAAFAVNNISSALQGLQNDLNNATRPGIDFNSSLKEMQAITGVSNETLKDIGSSARQMAKDFGVDASNGVETYKLLLSQLTPELVKAPESLAAMGRNAVVLSKQLGGDTAAATEILTTAMNQYGVSMDDPVAATRTMSEMMNIMSAAAKEGSAELPQIKAALEQSGMMARTANVSFSELNASVQVLDKAGKKGAEGGVALRNVMARLSEGQFMPRQTLEILKAAGIDVSALADKNRTLSQRLELLKPLLNDTAAMTQLFGTENVAAGIALVSNTQEIDSYNQKIVGTNTAQEMANTVMGSFSERLGRTNAWLKDMGISIFNATEGFLPFINMGMGALQVVANMGGAVQAFSVLGKTQLVTTIASAVTSLGTWIASTVTATAAQWGLNVAMYANPIGLVVLAVAAAVAAIAVLIKYWDDIKAAIFKFASWVWEHHPFKWLLDVTEKIFPGFKQKLADLWEWVKAGFEKIMGPIRAAINWVKGLFGSDDAGQTNDVAKSAAETFSNNVKIPGVNTPAAVSGASTVGGLGLSKNKTGGSTTASRETASNITSGGTRPNNISIVIQKLQDQTVIHTTNLQAGAKEAADTILDMIIETIGGANNALQTA
jgi:TP901 family phage tail tape measure protein